MLGAILGDIIGSPYEFGRGDKTKDFPLFSSESTFTDDTVMTAAVAEALLDAGRDADAHRIEAAVTDSMCRWGRRYPHVGYGRRFLTWLAAAVPEPYNSCGNGSAMRVSAAGRLYDTMEATRTAARATAVVTHNHPEGIKGAESTAAAIYLARTGAGKDKIRAYLTEEFGYDLNHSCDEIRPAYHHIVTCQQSVPQAFICFLEGTDFEDTVRNAVSLGGDADTQAAIAGSIAEAFWGISEALVGEGLHYLPADIRSVTERFYAAAERQNPRRFAEFPPAVLAAPAGGN